jgi:hypothetical protein
MLNRRHKVILFITLVTTGTALLAGATLAEGLGILILGVAFSWLVGSNTASRIVDSLRRVSAKTWPWLKLLLLMALGGVVLDAVAILSNYNSFVVAAALSIFGMAVSPFSHIPSPRWWLKVVVWIFGIAIFFLTAAGALYVIPTAEPNAGRIGELAVYALIAMPIGILWLAKGWKLVLRGINVEHAVDSGTVDEMSRRKSAVWLYVPLFFSTIALTLWLGLLAFPSFSNSTFAYEAKPTSTTSSGPLLPAIFLMLLARWPYGCWKSILEREPNTIPNNVRRHKVVTAVLGGFFTIVLCVAIVFGIQNGNDRKSTAQVEESAKSFQDIAQRIGAIKSRDLRTTKDYIAAYEEMDPLLAEFDTKLRQFTDILSEAEEQDRTRGPLNIQRLYRKHNEWMAWDTSTFELLHQDSELTSREIKVVRQMAELPEQEQVEFWKKNFQPLQQEEELLRQKLATAKQTMPNDGK